MTFPACSLEKTEISINMVDSDFGAKGQAVLKRDKKRRKQ